MWDGGEGGGDPVNWLDRDECLLIFQHILWQKFVGPVLLPVEEAELLLLLKSTDYLDSLRQKCISLDQKQVQILYRPSAD